MKFLTLSSLVTTGLCLLLLGLRIGGAVSLAEPLQVVTSGWEEENPISTSRLEIPFHGVVYNWLFDAWLSLPTVIDRSDRRLGVQAPAFAVLPMAAP